MIKDNVKANDFISDVGLGFAQKEVTVTAVNNKTYKILMDEKFKKTKIVKLVTDMVQRAEYCKRNDVEFDVTICLWAMILRYFTNIKFVEYEELGKRYENEVNTIKALIDLEIFEDIMKSVDKDETAKITNFSKDFSEMFTYMYQVQVDQALEELEKEDKTNGVSFEDEQTDSDANGEV